MALINCPECNNHVSAAAATCPNCGVGIASARESQAAGARLTTTQSTSKKLKMHTLLSALVFIMGLIFMFTMPDMDPEAGSSMIPALMVLTGLSWYLVTRFRIWWHHK